MEDNQFGASPTRGTGGPLGISSGTIRSELTDDMIAGTVERWDADTTSRKMELQVGRDLQFIRINGTVVGALAGLAIYTIATGVQTLF